MVKFFPRNGVLPKKIAGLWLVAVMFTMTACTLDENADRTQISVEKDGVINVKIVENFDRSYYDIGELQQQILTEAASYNRKMRNDNITVEKIEAKDAVATVIMDYVTAEDYAAFNHCVFFVGSAKEAQDAGYNLDVVLSGTNDRQETVGMSDILALEDCKVLITDCTEPVALHGKAVYISDHVTASKNRKTVTLAENSQELAYVIFR